MYICYDCKEIFDECGTHIERHPYGHGYAEEEMACCPCCKSTDVQKAIQCEECGEWFCEEEIENDICENCTKELLKKFRKLILDNFSEKQFDVIIEKIGDELF